MQPEKLRGLSLNCVFRTAPFFARRQGEQRQGAACKRRQNPRGQSRNGQAGEERGRKVHAGKAGNGRYPACKRRQISRGQSGAGQAGGERGRKMHAGEAGNGRGQRAKGGKIPAGRVETAKPAKKGEEKCTPARREMAGTQRAKGGKFPAGRQSSNICRGRTILFPTVPFVCREVDIIPENRRFYYFGSE